MTGRERGQRSKRRVGSRNHSQVFGNGKSTGTDEFLIGTLRAKTRRWADASRAPALQTPLTLATAAARALTAAFGAAAPARTARSILAKFMHSLGSTCGFPLNQSPEGFVAARTALEINEGEFQPRDPSAKASMSALISIVQNIQTLICQVAASASEWPEHHSLALAATEKSRAQRTLALSIHCASALSIHCASAEMAHRFVQRLLPTPASENQTQKRPAARTRRGGRIL